MISYKKCPLTSNNENSQIITDGRSLLEKKGFSEDEIDWYVDRVVSVLNDYAEKFGDNTEIEYTVRKRLNNIESRIIIPGEPYDPFENGEGAKKRKIESLFSLNLGSQASCIHHSYVGGRNIITGIIPLEMKKDSFLKNPNIWGAILGVIVGIILFYLPGNVNHFLIEELLNPVLNVVLGVIAGVMGPVIFIALVTSVIALDSVDTLTSMGFKLLKRFIVTILFFIIVSIGVSLLLFGRGGSESMDFSPNQIITMILNIFPTNLIRPFLENNTPQLVVLAFLTGVALLLLGDKTRELKLQIHQINDWVMNTMRLILRVCPAIPFLSLAIAIGRGNAKVLKEGWKFIAASYIIFTFCIIVKVIKTSCITKTPVSTLLRQAKPAVMTAFVTNSNPVALNQFYDISKKDMHIKPEYSSFFIPMSSAMLGIKTTVNVIIATFMMTELLGVPISLSFLFMLIILTMELSLASPGSTGSWLIAFEAFSIPSSNVGLFSTYKLFTDNYATGVVEAYDIFEQYEAAYKMNAIETGGGTSHHPVNQLTK